MKNPIVFVVGLLTNEKHKAWKIEGVFTDEKKAVKSCKTDMHFVGEMELDKVYSKNQKWTGAYYPKLESKPKR